MSNINNEFEFTIPSSNNMNTVFSKKISETIQKNLNSFFEKYENSYEKTKNNKEESNNNDRMTSILGKVGFSGMITSILIGAHAVVTAYHPTPATHAVFFSFIGVGAIGMIGSLAYGIKNELIKNKLEKEVENRNEMMKELSTFNISKEDLQSYKKALLGNDVQKIQEEKTKIIETRKNRF